MEWHFPNCVLSFCVLPHEEGVENAQVTIFLIQSDLKILWGLVALAMEDDFWVVKSQILVAPAPELVFL